MENLLNLLLRCLIVAEDVVRFCVVLMTRMPAKVADVHDVARTRETSTHLASLNASIDDHIEHLI